MVLCTEYILIIESVTTFIIYVICVSSSCLKQCEDLSIKGHTQGSFTCLCLILCSYVDYNYKSFFFKYLFCVKKCAVAKVITGERNTDI